MSRNHGLRSRFILRPRGLLLFILALPLFLTACGGGGGGGGVPGTFSIYGEVMAPGGTPGTAGFHPSQVDVLTDLRPLPGAAVEIHRFDNGQLIATVNTNANGAFTTSVIPQGTDLAFFASKNGANIRLSSALADVSSTRNTVRLDPASTLAAEAFGQSFYNQLKDITPNDYADTFSEAYQQLQGESTLDLSPGGPVLPPNFGGGLGSPPGLETVIAAIKGKVPAGISLPPSPVGIAKQMVQDLRDTQMGVGVATENAGWAQNGVFENEISPTFGSFGDRMGSVHRWVSELDGLAPARYQEDYLNGWLVQIGSSPNDRTWIVDGDSADPSGAAMTMTITAQNPIGTFSPRIIRDHIPHPPSAGSFTFQVTSTADAQLDYHGTISGQYAPDGIGTGINGSISLQDREVTTPITFNGSFSSIYLGTTWDGDGRFKSMTYTGLLSSKYITASFGTMRMTWFTDMTVDNDLQKIELLNLSASTRNVTDPVTVSGSLTLDFFRYPSGKETLKTLAFNGSVSDTQTISWTGSLNANWQNPKENLPSTDIPIGDVPAGTIGMTTTITPKSAAAFQFTFNVTSSPQANLNANDLSANLQIQHGNRSLTGAATARLDKQNGPSGVVTSGDVASAGVTLTSPDGYVLTMNWQRGQDVTGGVTAPGGQQVATFQHDSNLDLDVISYSDGTWESLASAFLDLGLG